MEHQEEELAADYVLQFDIANLYMHFSSLLVQEQ
jgi:hypothetical protein